MTTLPRKASRTQVTLLAGLTVAVLALCYARLFFGVDFLDEAFYAAIPYRFVLGARPFVDELNISQTFAFLTYPLVRLYVSLYSTNGLTSRCAKRTGSSWPASSHSRG